MNDEIREYIDSLVGSVEIKKPFMPKHDLSAYTENEYLREMYRINNDFDKIDDYELYIEYLKGD